MEGTLLTPEVIQALGQVGGPTLVVGVAAWLSVKGSLNGIKGDVRTMKDDVREMRGEVRGMDGRLTRLEARFDAHDAHERATP